jgi:four helix bundle protein
MSYKIQSFEKLEVYQLARNYKKAIKLISRTFPKEERFDLISQINRSASSITANLAEGSGRASNLDQANFTNMSYSSGLEIIDHLNTALDLEYIDKDKYTSYRVELDKILGKLTSLYKFQVNNKDTLKRKITTV